MKSGAPRSSSVARCSSPVASASPIAGSSRGTLLSSAASTSANFLLVSIFTCSTCNTCRVIVGSAIALSISVGQFADKPGHVRFGSKPDIGARPSMSALPPKADIGSQPRNVRFVPDSGILRCNQKTLLDHFVGGGEQRRWDCETKRLCGLEVNEKTEFGMLSIL